MLSMLRELWRYRGFIGGSVRRDFQARYANSLLGLAWAVIHPAAMITVYALIFSNVMSGRFPQSGGTFAYSAFLCSGILAWGVFSDTLLRAQNMILDNGNLLKKVSFPWASLPVIVAGNALANFLPVFGVFTLFLVVSGSFPGWTYVAVVPLLLSLILLAIGLGALLGALYVFFRDMGHMSGVGLQFWFWLTPVVYPLTVLPSSVANLIQLNPMTFLIEGFHAAMVYGQWPSGQMLLYPGGIGALACIWSSHVFNRLRGEMLDEL